MRLTDPWYDATFVGDITPEGSFRRLPGIEGAQALLLCSPCCYGWEQHCHYLIIPFLNPRNAPPVPPNFQPAPCWTMTGTGLHDLTISPSVDCQVEKPEHVEAHRKAGLGPGECYPGRKCWHGHIVCGEVT